VSNLSFGASVSAGVTSKAHQAHVSSLSCQAFACIRPVMRDDRGRHGLPSRFPVAFRLPAFASWAFLFPPRDCAFLAIGLPFTRVGRRGLDGVSMFRTNEIRVGSGAPFTPGLRCSHSRRKRISCRCRFSTASPALRSFSCLPELRVTKPHQGFTLVHPSTLPLACSLRTGQRPLGFSPRLRTPQLPMTHARAGTGIEHLPELRSRPTSTSYPRNPLVSCDLTSHVLGPVVQVLRLTVLD
jgi:hypothetical protein